MFGKKKNQKILFVTRTRTSRGGHIVLLEIVKELRKEGYDIELTTFESREKQTKIIPYWEEMEVNFVEIPNTNDRNAEQIEHIKAASVYIKENLNKFDRIILDSWFISLAAVRNNTFSEKIYHLVQSDPAFKPENPSEFWKSELFNILPLTAVNRIVVSKSLAKHFKERYEKHFDSIQLFLDDNYLNCDFNVKDRDVLRLVSSSATFNIPTKGLDFLLKQLEKIQEFKFELTLISGDEIKDNLSEYSFPIKIRNAKNSREMCEELCHHDVYVNTSTEESFCLALAEAIAIGMPTVALDSVGNREYMDGENAIFITKEEDFIPGLLKMKNLEFRKEISRKAKKSMQKFTVENTLKEFKKIIKI